MKKLVGFVAVILLAVLVMTFFGPFTSGTKTERVSDQVMIGNAIDYYLENRQYDRAKVPGGGINLYKIFENREEFVGIFPDCCRFTKYGTEGPGGLKLSRRERKKSDFAGVVIIKAKARRIQGDEIIMVRLLGHEIYMNRSGEVIPY